MDSGSGSQRSLMHCARKPYETHPREEVDVQQSTSDELDDLLKVYRYNLNNAGIRTDPVIGKDIVMIGDTYIYDGNLYLTGNIHKGTYS